MATNELEKKLDYSIFLMLITRLSIKSLGIISTLFLVRMLSQDDFGIVAITMSIYSLIQVFGQFGFSTVLIQKQSPLKSDYDTVFTINLLFGLCAAFIIFMAAPWLSDFFNDVRLVAVFKLIALMFILNSLLNIKVVNFQKNMEFDKEFKFQLLPKIISVIVTLTLAFYLENYWALVYGMLVYSFLTTFISYFMIPYCPSLSFIGGKKLFGFSKWIMFNGLFNYLNNKSMDIILGKLISTRAVGLYSISQEMATLPVHEVAAPINKAAFPAYSRASASLTDLYKLYSRTISMITMISLPMCIGLYSVSEYFVPVVLGDKWLDAVDIIKYISLASFLTSLTTNNSYVLIAIGKPEITTLISGLRIGILFSLLWYLMEPTDINTPALAIFFCSIVNLIISFFFLVSYTGFSLKNLLLMMYRPIFACSVMLLFILLAKEGLSSYEFLPIFNLIYLVVLGFFSYFISIFVLWFLHGKPDTIEAKVWTKMKNITRKII